MDDFTRSSAGWFSLSTCLNVHYSTFQTIFLLILSTDLENLWISEPATNPLELGKMAKLEINFRSGRAQIQRVAWNGPRSILILTNTWIATIEVSLEKSFAGKVFGLVGLRNPCKCETTSDKKWAICTDLPDRATSREVRGKLYDFIVVSTLIDNISGLFWIFKKGCLSEAV